MARFDRYGMITLIVIGLMAVTGVLSTLILPIIQTIAHGFITLILYPG